jgi:hypothetical protein
MREFDTLTLAPFMKTGLVMSFQPFGASSGFTFSVLQASPAKVTPIQK